MKNIIICSDGTWNRPEEFGKENEQHPTNVLRFARGIAPRDSNDNKQVVFYDWGIGSYHNSLTGGGMGAGLEKNVMDGYRFLVHNYEPGDRIYLFGFSRGAYTVRSLCGMLNNCHILKTENAKLVEAAFNLYKTRSHKPNGDHSKNWRSKYSRPNSGHVHFIGVWDTVGALGLPGSFLGMLKDKHLFYDHELGSNIGTARHALSLDETRNDFEPTIWKPRPEVDLKQVWFAGVHSDVGGSYAPDKDKTVLSDIPLMWMLREAKKVGLSFEDYFPVPASRLNPKAPQNDEANRIIFRILGREAREIPIPNENEPNLKKRQPKTLVHVSVKERYGKKVMYPKKRQKTYISEPIENFVAKTGKWPEIEE